MANKDMSRLEVVYRPLEKAESSHLRDALYEAVTGNTCAAEEGSEVTE